MRSDQLDISIEDLESGLMVRLEGVFYAEQIPGVREKIEALVSEENIEIFLDLEKVVLRDQAILQFLLEMLNLLRSRRGNLVLLVKREESLEFLQTVRHIFPVFSGMDEYRRSGFVKTLRRTGVLWSRKTGVRLSPPVALLLLFLAAGWALTLLSIIRDQDSELFRQSSRVVSLEHRRDSLVHRVEELSIQLAPLRSLGLVNDSLETGKFHFTSDWVQYLELLEKRDSAKLEKKDPK